MGAGGACMGASKAAASRHQRLRLPALTSCKVSSGCPAGRNAHAIAALPCAAGQL